MDYNTVGSLIAQVSERCTTFGMVTDNGGLLSFYFVPEWERKEGYFNNTQFQLFEIEGITLTLEKILRFVKEKKEGEGFVRGKLAFFKGE